MCVYIYIFIIATTDGCGKLFATNFYLSDPDSGPTYWQQTTHVKPNYDTVKSLNLSKNYDTNVIEYCLGACQGMCSSMMTLQNTSYMMPIIFPVQVVSPLILSCELLFLPPISVHVFIKPLNF